MRSSADAPRGWPEGFGRGPDERLALLALSHAGTAGAPRRMHALGWASGSAVATLRAVEGGALGARAAALVGALQDQAVAKLRACGARLLTGDELPEALLDLHDPPAWLFLRGAIPEGPAVSIVGARKATPYGLEVAEALGRAAAARGVVVVSGAALGADAAAHRGALGAGGPTVAILGSGIDEPHPRSHADLIDRLAEEGAVLSEYPPGTPPARWRFPARNRLVAAFSRGTVVVEGAAGSGSLITAELAGQLGREVMAVPGALTNPLSVAPNGLIRDGARMITGPADVLEGVGVQAGAEPAATEALPEREERVLGGIGSQAATAESIARATRSGLREVLTALASLELRGLVREYGGRYERTILAARAAEDEGGEGVPAVRT